MALISERALDAAATRILAAIQQAQNALQQSLLQRAQQACGSMTIQECAAAQGQGASMPIEDAPRFINDAQDSQALTQLQLDTANVFGDMKNLLESAQGLDIFTSDTANQAALGQIQQRLRGIVDRAKALGGRDGAAPEIVPLASLDLGDVTVMSPLGKVLTFVGVAAGAALAVIGIRWLWIRSGKTAAELPERKREPQDELAPRRAAKRAGIYRRR